MNQEVNISDLALMLFNVDRSLGTGVLPLDLFHGWKRDVLLEWLGGWLNAELRRHFTHNANPNFRV